MQLVVSEDLEYKNTICSFDVNDFGQVALGLCNHTINVYNSNNHFQYSYTFQSAGDYYVEWGKGCLIIYFVRSHIAVAVDSLGNLVEMRDIDINSLHNSHYWRNLRQTSKKINNSDYVIKKDLGLLNYFASSYSKLVKTDSNGIEYVVYDATNIHKRLIISDFVFYVGLFTVVVVGVSVFVFKKNISR